MVCRRLYHFTVKTISCKGNRTTDFLSRYPDGKNSEDDKLELQYSDIAIPIYSYLIPMYSANMNLDDAEKKYDRLSRNYVVNYYISSKLQEYLSQEVTEACHKTFLVAVPQTLIKGMSKFYHFNLSI